MASVLGLLEAREKKVREKIARLREESERVQAAAGRGASRTPRLRDGESAASSQRRLEPAPHP